MTLLSLLTSLVNSIGTLIGLLLTTISGLIQILLNLPTYINYLNTILTSIFPNTIQAFLVCLIALSTVLFVVNRGAKE